MPEIVETLIEGGKATPGPPIGPALGGLGINIMEVVKAINQATAEFTGMKVPVKIIVEPKTREFKIEVGTPPTSALILKELGVEKGAGKVRDATAGNLAFEQVVKIAKLKRSVSFGKSLVAVVKEVLGTCVSVGVTVDNKDAREIQKLIDSGEYRAKIK